MSESYTLSVHQMHWIFFFFSDHFSYQRHHYSFLHQNISSNPSMDLSCQAVFKCVAWLDLRVLWWYTHELNMSFFKLFFIPKRHHHSYPHQSMLNNPSMQSPCQALFKYIACLDLRVLKFPVKLLPWYIGLLSRKRVIWQPVTNIFWQLATKSSFLPHQSMASNPSMQSPGQALFKYISCLDLRVLWWWI